MMRIKNIILRIWCSKKEGKNSRNQIHINCESLRYVRKRRFSDNLINVIWNFLDAHLLQMRIESNQMIQTSWKRLLIVEHSMDTNRAERWREAWILKSNQHEHFWIYSSRKNSYHYQNQWKLIKRNNDSKYSLLDSMYTFVDPVNI
jgi:hypothetical protein